MGAKVSLFRTDGSELENVAHIFVQMDLLIIAVFLKIN